MIHTPTQIQTMQDRANELASRLTLETAPTGYNDT